MLRNHQYMIFIIVVALLLGVTGISLAVGNDGVDNGERGIRIQDTGTFIPDRNDEIIISAQHYANIAFYINLFVTSPNSKTQEYLDSNIATADGTTTFNFTLIDDVTEKQYDLKGNELSGNSVDSVTFKPDPVNYGVSLPIRVIIPSSSTWSLKIESNNSKFITGQTSMTVLNAPITYDPTNPEIKPTPRLGVVISPQDPTVEINESIQFTAKLFNIDIEPESEITTQPTDWTWYSGNSAIAKSIELVGTFKGIAQGTIGITANYQSGTAVLATNTTNLTVLGGEPDHLAVVSLDSGGVPVPRLNIRSDTGPVNSTWGYIGEPMTINVALQMRDRNDEIADFDWDTSLATGFYNPDHWDITFTSDSGELEHNLYDIEVFLITGSDSPSMRATLKVTLKNTWITQNEFNNFQLKLDPYFMYNGQEIKLSATARAVVLDESGKVTDSNNLYRGLIRAEDNYFYSTTGNANIYVEKYHNGHWVLNTEDSTSKVTQWLLDDVVLKDNLESDIQTSFMNGKTSIYSINWDSTDAVKLLAPAGYPTYFLTVPGTLTWGQIVDNPPTQEGSLWEVETPE